MNEWEEYVNGTNVLLLSLYASLFRVQLKIVELQYVYSVHCTLNTPDACTHMPEKAKRHKSGKPHKLEYRWNMRGNFWFFSFKLQWLIDTQEYSLKIDKKIADNHCGPEHKTEFKWCSKFIFISSYVYSASSTNVHKKKTMNRSFDSFFFKKPLRSKIKKHETQDRFSFIFCSIFR